MFDPAAARAVARALIRAPAYMHVRLADGGVWPCLCLMCLVRRGTGITGALYFRRLAMARAVRRSVFRING